MRRNLFISTKIGLLFVFLACSNLGGERVAKLNQSIRLYSGQKIQIPDSNMILEVKGVTTIKPSRKQVVQLVNFRITDGTKRVDFFLESLNGEPAKTEVKNYVIILEDASGYQAYCQVRIEKKGVAP